MIMDNEELKKLFDAVLSDKLKLLAKEYGFRSGKLALKKKNSDKNIIKNQEFDLKMLNLAGISLE
jgi:hypothetical protein